MVRQSHNQQKVFKTLKTEKMKKIILASAIAFGLLSAVNAQNGRYDDYGDRNSNRRYEQRRDRDDDDDDYYEGRGRGRGRSHEMKNIPAQVRRSFRSDFPNASHVNWSKDRNIWTATFNANGRYNNQLRSASYYSNGQRADARNNAGYGNNGGYGNSNELPYRVQQAFQRDYPSATNVSWSNDRDVWTATFRSGGVFGGSQTVSYYSNGERADNNGTYNGNVPYRVQQSFQRDFPNASNVSWAYNNRVWAATFRSGLFGSKTAGYYENGDRAY